MATCTDVFFRSSPCVSENKKKERREESTLLMMRLRLYVQGAAADSSGYFDDGNVNEPSSERCMCKKLIL